MSGKPEVADGKQWDLSHLSPEMPVLGFTGAIGSGCTTLSKALADYHDYLYCPLSAALHDEAKERGVEESFANLQTIGNEYRDQHGLDILVWLALAEADEVFATHGPSGKYKGIVLDGIRNTGEVQCLRQMANFFLFSVQTEERLQRERLLESERCKDDGEYRSAIAHDAEEYIDYGQQINLCNELADIVVLNCDPVQVGSGRLLREYVDRKVYGPYVNLIETLSQPLRQVVDYSPTVDQALMTAAFVQSKRSRCLKRKVGAIIATVYGDIVASGYNDVPEGSLPCWEHPVDKWCHRDVVQERAGRRIKHCPHCGAAVIIRTACTHCKQPIASFTKRCTNCSKDPEVRYACPACGTPVFQRYLAGASIEAGKMLDICRSLHAEENAILRLSRTGIPVPDRARMFVTAFPCNLCANKIAMLGIKEVVYSEPYVTKEARDILEKGGVNLKPFEGVKSSAYFRLYG